MFILEVLDNSAWREAAQDASLSKLRSVALRARERGIKARIIDEDRPMLRIGSRTHYAVVWPSSYWYHAARMRTRFGNRTVTVAGSYQWHLVKGVWRAVGHPRLRIEPVVKSRGRRTWAMWVLKPKGLQFRDYTQAMLAAEGLKSKHWKEARMASRKKAPKKPKRPNLVARGMILSGTGRGGPHGGKQRAKERERAWTREEWGDYRRFASAVIAGRQARPEAVKRLRTFLAARVGEREAERQINELLRYGWHGKK